MSRRGGSSWPGLVLVGLVLAASVAMAAWVVVGWVGVATADTREATVTEVDRRFNQGADGRTEPLVRFELAEDGESHSTSVTTRWLWNPSEGDTVDVFERSSGDWEIAQEHSWPRDVLVLLACLVPWVLLYLVVEDRVRKRRRRATSRT